MRIFDTYGFNIIDKAKFKETREYLDKMLEETGFMYKNVAFGLSSFVGEYDKLYTKRPEIQKYDDYKENIRAQAITSMGKGWSCGKIHADKQDWSAIFETFSKIPRPYNFLDAVLILDQIKWHDNTDDDIAVSVDEETFGIVTGNVLPFTSNSIVSFHKYDDGRKRNIVTVNIEITSPEGIIDSRPIIEKLAPYLGVAGKPYRQCILSPEEKKNIKQLEKKHCDAMNEMAASVMPEEIPVNKDFKAEDERFTVNKAVLTPLFKGSGFKRAKNGTNWLHTYECIDENGIKYEAEVQVLQNTFGFRCDFFASGYNFHAGMLSRTYDVCNEEQCMDILKKFLAYAKKMRDEYGKELAADFGATPDWFYNA